MQLSSLIRSITFLYGFGYDNASVWIYTLKVSCSLDVSFKTLLEWAQLAFYGLRYGPITAPCSGSASAPLQSASGPNFSSLTSELVSNLFIRVVGLSLSFSTN